MSNPSFVGFVATQFLGAFNDNLFKQLLLLLAMPVVVVAAANGAGGGAGEVVGTDLQGIATIVFSLPFVLFGGVAGYLADRFSKRRVIVLSKTAEIAVMLLGLVAFLAAPVIGFAGLWVVMFLMGTQSAFFGPGKYGILPEMLRREQLPRANGIIVMTTFIAIILGTSSAGQLKEWLDDGGADRLQSAQQLWLAALVCIGIAAAGTAVSLLIRPVTAAAAELKFSREYLLVPRPMRRLLLADRPLIAALLASCGFWMIAGLTLQSVNSLCRVQLGWSDGRISVMTALISVGIAVGGVLAGLLARKLGDRTLIAIGTWGVVACCGVLSLTLPGIGLVVGEAGLPWMLVLLGAAAAFFALPIQVFLQARPPAELKGRMIAVMNQANFVAIVAAGAIYMLLDRFVTAMDWPRSTLFGAMALMFLPVAIFFRLDGSPPPAASLADVQPGE